MNSTKQGDYKFDFYYWGNVINEIKIENELKIKEREKIQRASIVSEKLTRKMVKDAIQLAINTQNYASIPDDISNSDISNDSKEIHVDKKRKKNWNFYKCWNYFFRKKYNVT
jgi:hypothetical protein